MTSAYPRYRDSGVGWIGRIPEHWAVGRLGHVASYRTSNVDKKTKVGELPIRLCNYTDVYYRERIRAEDGDFMEATVSPRELGRFRLNVGDVLVTKDSEDWEDIAVPALVESTDDDFVCGYHLGIIRPGALADPTYLLRAMQSVSINVQFQLLAQGVTRYGVTNRAFDEARLPLPPLEEQRAIAAFIDHETAKVDALSERAETAIERLFEYRSALIAHAVTGAFDVRGSVAAAQVTGGVDG